MKILIINWQDKNNPYAGGAETHLHEIFSRIALQGHDVFLLCSGFRGALKEEVLDDGISVFRTGTRATFNFCVPSAYQRLRKRLRPNLIVDDINKIPFWTPLYVKEPLLCISHHLFGRSIFREVDPVRALYVYSAERCLPLVYREKLCAAVSESTRQELIHWGWKPERISVIHNGIDHSRFPMRVGIKASFPMVSYFGRIKRYKCPDHLLRAFAVVVKYIPDARLYFIGDGDYVTQLRELAQRLSLLPYVVWTGKVTEKEKIDLLSQSWCVVNTSMKEGWGITTIEANACGTPVIAADVPGLRDAVKDGVSGLLYTFANLDELSGRILRMLTDNMLRQQLSMGAVEWARTFSWDASAQAMLALCHAAIEERKHLQAQE